MIFFPENVRLLNLMHIHNYHSSKGVFPYENETQIEPKFRIYILAGKVCKKIRKRL